MVQMRRLFRVRGIESLRINMLEPQMSPSALTSLPFSIYSLHAAYAQGTTAQSVLSEVLRRIEALDDPGIFIHLATADALNAAAFALGPFDPVAKPLWGIPFAVKDNIDVAGMPTSAACPDFIYQATTDAFAVAQLKAAGAIPVGKTNLDQFATGLVGVRTPYPVPRNAIDPAIVPGGSSSGSSVIVSYGAVTFSLGTDTAGSGRVPAALNNIVGLKPSLGMISNSGVIPACRTLDTISVFALTVADAFKAFTGMVAYDAADAFSRLAPTPALRVVPKNTKIAVPNCASRIFNGDDAQAQSFDHSLDRLASLGAEIVEIDFQPFYDVAALLYHGPWVAERYAAIRTVYETQLESLHPVTRMIVGGAEKFSAADTFEAMYQLADLRRMLEPVIASVDMLCVPSIPTFYNLNDLDSDPVGPNTQLGAYTNFVNLLDMCGITVPTQPRQDGRPGSVTLLARWGADGEVASLADALHRAEDPLLGATGLALASIPAEPLCTDPSSDEIAVALVGAHMQGLPLNHQIVGRGGRFLYAADTAADYRIYSLAAGPPERPGLVRQTDGSGAAIALEVWAMPQAAFGAFMLEIPQPLGIGTINLSNGLQVKGFLCEPAGLEGADDITQFGGWRGYLAREAV